MHYATISSHSHMWHFYSSLLSKDPYKRAIFTIAPIRWAASAPRLPPLRHRTRSIVFWFWFGTGALKHAAVLIRESKRAAAGTRFYSARGRWQGSRSEILVATWHVRNCSRRRRSLTAAHSYRYRGWNGLKWRNGGAHRARSANAAHYIRYCN